MHPKLANNIVKSASEHPSNLDGISHILHIGTPKTGTTALQNIVFPRSKNVIYLGKTLELKKIWKQIDHKRAQLNDEMLYGFYLHQFIKSFDRSDLDNKSRCKKEFVLNKKLINKKEDEIYFYSKEGIISNGDEIITDKKIEKNESNLIEIGDTIGGNLLLLLTLRNPVDYIYSKYCQLQHLRLKRGFELQTPEDYLVLQLQIFERNPWHSVFQHASQKNFCDKLRSLGVGKLVVLSYEQDIRDCSSITDTFRRKLGVTFYDGIQTDNEFRSSEVNNATAGKKALSVKSLLRFTAKVTLADLKKSFLDQLFGMEIYSEIENDRLF